MVASYYQTTGEYAYLAPVFDRISAEIRVKNQVQVLQSPVVGKWYESSVCLPPNGLQVLLSDGKDKFWVDCFVDGWTVSGVAGAVAWQVPLLPVATSERIKQLAK